MYFSNAENKKDKTRKIKQQQKGEILCRCSLIIMQEKNKMLEEYNRYFSYC